MICKLALAAVALLALGACSETTPEQRQNGALEKAQELVFSQNRQTGICIASRSWGWESGTAFAVPCTPEVLAAINGGPAVAPVTEVHVR